MAHYFRASKHACNRCVMCRERVTFLQSSWALFVSKPITAWSAEFGHVLLLTLIDIVIFATRIKGIFQTFVEATSLMEKVEFLSIFKLRIPSSAASIKQAGSNRSSKRRLCANSVNTGDYTTSITSFANHTYLASVTSKCLFGEPWSGPCWQPCATTCSFLITIFTLLQATIRP